MKSQAKKRPYKKIALALGLCAILIWAILGAGASLAWFTDTSEEVTNIFHVADFEVEVSHRLPDGTWEKVDGQTKIFDEDALYEPGYVQVVYLKVENAGDREFEFDTAVIVTGYTVATNVFGQQFNLQEFLKFGLVPAKTEEEMLNSVPSRDVAKQIATMKLNRYYVTEEKTTLAPGEASYMTLIVRMPEEVNNVANYRGDVVPQVELGIVVKAEQIKK